MTASLIAPVIPPARVRAGWAARPAGYRPLPLAAPEIPGALPAGLVYGLGRIDGSGRVADRAVALALGWQSGDRLTMTGAEGIVVARRTPGGMVTIAARGYIAIPAALRRRCGMRAGDRVLLAAVPGEDTLTAYPLALVDQAIREHRRPLGPHAGEPA